MIDTPLTENSSGGSLFSVSAERLSTGMNVIDVKNSVEIAENYLSDPTGFPNHHFQTSNGMYKFTVKPTSDLLKELLTHHYDLKWIDVEATYYDLLKRQLHEMKGYDKPRDFIPSIRELNDHLSILRSALKQYLKKVSVNRYPKDNFAYTAKESVSSELIIDKKARKLIEDTYDIRLDAPIKTDEVMFLNFNYTTLCRRLESVGFGFKYIDIHGSLQEDDEQLIFGYGDEIDESYIEMEKTNFNDFLTHIKSFGYSQDDNYSNLVRFINVAPFSVYIWGHSCGLSDRTLLNMVFEHDNCTLIKPFYWRKNQSSDNYTEIVQNISRHFRDKQKMRNRVANKKFCQPL